MSQSVLALRCFILSSLFASLVADSGTDRSWKAALVQAETILRKDCGEHCIEVLHSLVASPLFSNGTVDISASALDLAADRLLQKVDHADQVRSMFAGSTASFNNDLNKQTKLSLVPVSRTVSADTPCNSETLCSIDGLAANKCSYMRKGLQIAYQGLNIVVHVMGVLITALCGCLFVFTQAKCILSNIPPVCIRPYSVYSKAFSGSVQMWESVKSMTKTCIIHGSPKISS